MKGPKCGGFMERLARCHEQLAFDAAIKRVGVTDGKQVDNQF